MAFHVRQEFTLKGAAHLLPERLKSLSRVPAAPGVVDHLQRQWKSLGRKQSKSAAQVLKNVLLTINSSNLGFTEIETLRRELQAKWEGFFPAALVDDWLDDEPDAVLQWCEAQLDGFRAAVLGSGSEFESMLFMAGETFESAWCRSDVGELLTSASDRLRWKTIDAEESTPRSPRADGKNLTAPPEIEEYKGPSQTLLAKEDIYQLVPPLKCREVGELQPARNWHLTMANAVQQIQRKVKSGTLNSQATLRAIPDTMPTLNETLAQVHSEIVKLMSAHPVSRQVEPSNHEASEVSPGDRVPAVRVDLEQHRIWVRGTWYVVSKKAAIILNELVEADGEYVNVSKMVGMKSRVLTRLPLEVQALIESQPGAGTRILRGNLWIN